MFGRITAVLSLGILFSTVLVHAMEHEALHSGWIIIEQTTEMLPRDIDVYNEMMRKNKEFDMLVLRSNATLLEGFEYIKNTTTSAQERDRATEIIHTIRAASEKIEKKYNSYAFLMPHRQ